jgi:hypothetical protein
MYTQWRGKIKSQYYHEKSFDLWIPLNTLGEAFFFPRDPQAIF